MAKNQILLQALKHDKPSSELKKATIALVLAGDNDRAFKNAIKKHIDVWSALTNNQLIQGNDDVDLNFAGEKLKDGSVNDDFYTLWKLSINNALKFKHQFKDEELELFFEQFYGKIKSIEDEEEKQLLQSLVHPILASLFLKNVKDITPDILINNVNKGIVVGKSENVNVRNEFPFTINTSEIQLAIFKKLIDALEDNQIETFLKNSGTTAAFKNAISSLYNTLDLSKFTLLSDEMIAKLRTHAQSRSDAFQISNNKDTFTKEMDQLKPRLRVSEKQVELLKTLFNELPVLQQKYIIDRMQDSADPLFMLRVMQSNSIEAIQLLGLTDVEKSNLKIQPLITENEFINEVKKIKNASIIERVLRVRDELGNDIQNFRLLVRALNYVIDKGQNPNLQDNEKFADAIQFDDVDKNKLGKIFQLENDFNDSMLFDQINAFLEFGLKDRNAQIRLNKNINLTPLSNYLATLPKIENVDDFQLKTISEAFTQAGSLQEFKDALVNSNAFNALMNKGNWINEQYTFTALTDKTFFANMTEKDFSTIKAEIRKVALDSNNKEKIAAQLVLDKNQIIDPIMKRNQTTKENVNSTVQLIKRLFDKFDPNFIVRLLNIRISEPPIPLNTRFYLNQYNPGAKTLSAQIEKMKTGCLTLEATLLNQVETLRIYYRSLDDIDEPSVNKQRKIAYEHINTIYHQLKELRSTMRNYGLPSQYIENINIKDKPYARIMTMTSNAGSDMIRQTALGSQIIRHAPVAINELFTLPKIEPAVSSENIAVVNTSPNPGAKNGEEINSDTNHYGTYFKKLEPGFRATISVPSKDSDGKKVFGTFTEECNTKNQYSVALREFNETNSQVRVETSMTMVHQFLTSSHYKEGDVIYLTGKNEGAVADMYFALLTHGIEKKRIDTSGSVFDPDKKKGMIIGYASGSEADKSEQIFKNADKDIVEKAVAEYNDHKYFSSKTKSWKSRNEQIRSKIDDQVNKIEEENTNPRKLGRG